MEMIEDYVYTFDSLDTKSKVCDCETGCTRNE